MAIIRMSPIIGGISGNLGGQNFANSRYGPLVRRATSRANQATNAQLARRTRFLQVTRAWQSLSTKQRDSWRTSALLVRKINRLGLRRPMSGFQFFQRQNLADVDTTTIVEEPPTILTVTPTPQRVGPFFPIATEIHAKAFLPSLGVQTTVFIFGARPITDRPITWFQSWKYLQTEEEGFGLRNWDVTATFEAALGLPANGETIGIRIKTRAQNQMFSPFAFNSGTVSGL